MENKIYPVCVIGGGSAGVMAVLRTVLNNDECLFFPGSAKDKKKSRAMWVRKIENMPAHLQYTKGITQPNDETLKWISESQFAENLRHEKNTGIVKIQKHDGIFQLTDSKGTEWKAQYVVLATGVMDVQPTIKGSIGPVFDYANAQTIDYCIICDGHHVFNKRTAIIGHTNNAAWVAIMLHERYAPPKFTILTNGEIPRFEADTEKLLTAYGIEVLSSPIKEIIGEDKGKVLQAFVLDTNQRVDADIAFVSLGMIVYNELAKQLSADLDERGFVKTAENGESSVPGLFVAGDLRANTKKQIYTAWDNAVTAVNAINLKLRVERRRKLSV